MRYWRRFYEKHKEGVDLLGEILLSLSLFALIPSLYIILWILDAGRL